MSTLLVDAGNTRIKWREVARAEFTAGRNQGFAACPTAHVETVADALVRSASGPIARALVSCVAGDDVMQALTRTLHAAWPAIDIRRIEATSAAFGVVNGYAEPTRLGADRWAALIGAHAGWAARPLLVCGVGTATTIDLLIPTAAGGARFVGGSILPGFEAMRRALTNATAALSTTTGRAVDFAIRTEDAIASGIQQAQVGAIVMAMSAARSRLVHSGIDTPLLCLLAGGDAERLAKPLSCVIEPLHVVPDLVLRGLGVVAAGEALSNPMAA